MTERSTAMEGLTLERGYTTKDFTALRAYVQRIPPAAIARTYYDPDEDTNAATPGAMERHLPECSTRWCNSRSRMARPYSPSTCVRRASSTVNRS